MNTKPDEKKSTSTRVTWTFQPSHEVQAAANVRYGKGWDKQRGFRSKVLNEVLVEHLLDEVRDIKRRQLAEWERSKGVKTGSALNETVPTIQPKQMKERLGLHKARPKVSNE